MWTATIRGLMARKVRLALTALAVVLGVAFVSGTYVLTDTLHRAFAEVSRQTEVGTDLVVRSRAPYGSEDAQRARVPASLVERVRPVPGVLAAEGFLQGYAQFVSKDGRHAIQTSGAPTFGISWGTTDQVGPLRIERGRPPRRDGEVAMDAGTAHRNGFHVGDAVKVLLTGPAERFRIVGLFGFGNRFDFGALSFAAFDTHTAQRVFDARGLFDLVNVRVQPGVPVRIVQERVGRALGGVYEVTSAARVATETRKPLDDALNTLNDALLGFAGIGVLVGGFIIFNTFTILVSQRIRELGLLRALGASGPQVIGSVLAEAVVVGAIASGAGFGLGIALARFLLWLLPSVGLTVPSAALVVIARTLVVSGLVGVGVTTLAAVYPAVRAARTPPVAAIGDLRLATGAGPTVWRSVIGAVVIGAGVAILVEGVYGGLDTNYAVAVAFLGGFVVFLGLVVLGPLLARPLAGLVGRPLPAVLGVTGTLARGNAMRNPRRTSATAAALVVGLGLVSLVAIFADSLKTSVRSSLTSSVRADYIVSAPQFSGFSSEIRDRMAAVPGVRAAVALRFGDVRIKAFTETITGATTRGIDDVFDLSYVAGGARGLEHGGILLDQREADGYHRRVGDVLAVTFPRPGFQELPVVGIYRHRRVTGAFPVSFIVSDALFRAAFGGTQQDTLVYVKADPGQVGAVGKAIRRVLREPFPNVNVETVDQYQAEREATVDQFLNVFVALLFLSELIAVLGIVNTLMLSVYERTRELGLLRAVGMSRLQVRRMVRGESVVIAVLGCALGVLVGLGWGWAVVTALKGQFVDRLSVPPMTLAWFVVASAAAGLVAALLPAWRASRLDVLEAIAEE